MCILNKTLEMRFGFEVSDDCIRLFATRPDGSALDFPAVEMPNPDAGLDAALWIGERQDEWGAWLAQIERRDIQQLHARFMNELSLYRIDKVKKISVDLGSSEEPEISICLTLEKRDVEVFRHRFATPDLHAAFVLWAGSMPMALVGFHTAMESLLGDRHVSASRFDQIARESLRDLHNRDRRGKGRKPLPHDLSVHAWGAGDTVLFLGSLGIEMRRTINLDLQTLYDLMLEHAPEEDRDLMRHLVVVDDETSDELKKLFRSTIRKLRPDQIGISDTVAITSRKAAERKLDCDISGLSLSAIDRALFEATGETEVTIENLDCSIYGKRMNKIISRRWHGRSISLD